MLSGLFSVEAHPEGRFDTILSCRQIVTDEVQTMSISTGTLETRTEHAESAAVAGFLASVAIPALVAIVGLLAMGWAAISWWGAVVWGLVATIAFTLFTVMGKAVGMTRMDLLDLLGSMLVQPGTAKSRRIGLMMHLMNGALLAIAWAYGVALLGWSANWFTGLLWGAVLWALALLMMSTMGVVHPAIRAGKQADPGPAATNFGKMTPLGSLLGHLVWGVVLGLLYQTWPLG